MKRSSVVPLAMHLFVPDAIYEFPVLASFILIFILLVSLVQIQRSRRSRLPLPPGPTPLPLVGNVFDMPKGKMWETFAEWSKIYDSDIIFLDLPMQPTLIVTSVKTALELMDKRSAIYSDKPATIMDELTGWDWCFSIMPYGTRWREGRRCFHQYFHQNAVSDYYPIQLREVRAFLRRAYAHKDVDVDSICQIFAASILDVVYGKRIHDMHDEYISIARESVEAFSQSRLPGKFWLDYVPIMKHIPSWVPGAAARKFGERFKPIVQYMRNSPFDTVVKELSNGSESMSVAHQLMRKLQQVDPSDPVFKKQEQTARDATGLAYSAGIDTLLSTVSCFILAMGMFPEVQHKAQEELDLVVGSERLPNFEDKSSLPYIRAIALESLRWMPVLPLGIPHRVLTEDEYRGYRIPKGTVIISDSWAMLHDPEIYPDPERFNPDRYLVDGQLNPEVMHPDTVAFGYGRRICAGRHFADNTLFITIASILHVFNILPKMDEYGNPVQLRAESTVGVFSYPADIRCTFSARSPTAERLIVLSETAS